MEKEETKGGKAAGSKKKLVLIVALVLALAGGGAYYFLFAGGTSAPEPGKVVALEPITVNLNEGHYLKLRLALQATSDASGDLDGSRALDLAVSEFSNREVGELSSNAARDSSKEILKKKVSDAYAGEVMDIYFTEFVME
ncbi:MAG TPA: flagellar basal body-associated FliL family protein [Actinophytocola sp.]|uniref:flagellar basal body-associated FliL family protein n=1 Tax=Actinophytocola sp. TaxID=1872138 RepID=UPI002DBAF6DD|nr:flagellar basal body-associated FliL family protein [Actinophytocola sp.]HEU5474223.1 flagellar basal body-associated FliL family protein [Actinophytocola sp.]